MGYTTFHYGKPCYVLEGAKTKVITTIQGACTLPYFNVEGKEICPYWIAPWWNDRPLDDGQNISTVLRGNFFCLSRMEDHNDPEHGWCATLPWEIEGVKEEGSDFELALAFEAEPDGGVIRKKLAFHENETAVYEENLISGYEGNYSICDHPCVKLPGNPKNSHFTMSEPEAGYTCKSFMGGTETRSYMFLERNQEIHDIHSVRSIYGENVDLAHHPVMKGAFDLIQFAERKERDICFAAFVNKEEGYIYYQLKNPKEYPYVMLWIFNGGRYFEPWNGTMDGCLGVEDLAEFAAQLFPNETDTETGKGKYNTCTVLEPGREYSYKQIYGVVKMPEGYEGVADIQYTDEGIVIVGLDGSEIPAKVDWKYLLKDNR